MKRHRKRAVAVRNLSASNFSLDSFLLRPSQSSWSACSGRFAGISPLTSQHMVALKRNEGFKFAGGFCCGGG